MDRLYCNGNSNAQGQALGIRFKGNYCLFFFAFKYFASKQYHIHHDKEQDKDY